MNLAPLVASFALVAVAELGDKTQIAVITLSSRSRALSVFLGAMLAFVLISGVAVAVGDALAIVLPAFWIRIIAASIFIIFGLYTIVSKKRKKQVETRDSRNAILSSFSLITLMELGDKTQFAVVALSAEFESPFLVFLGVMIAFVLVTALGVTVGKALTRFVPLKYIEIGSGLVFMLFGIFFLLSAVLGYASII